MQRFFIPLSSLVCIAFLMVTTSCDWTGGGDSEYNSSRNDGSNISGVYEGQLEGGFAVASTRLGILRFTVLQSGGDIQVTDNFGSTYTGRVGNRLSSQNNVQNNVQTTGDADTDSEENTGGGDTTGGGTEFTTFLVSFSGTNQQTGRAMSFSGTVVIVIDTEIVGFTFDEESGVIQDAITESTLTLTMKGTWVEPGTGAFNVDAQVTPIDVAN